MQTSEACPYCLGTHSRANLGNYFRNCPSCGQGLTKFDDDILPNSYRKYQRYIVRYLSEWQLRRRRLRYLTLIMKRNISEIEFINAASEGDIEVVREFLLQGGNANYICSNTGLTALHYAAGHRAGKVVDVLLAHEGIDPLIRDRRGRLPSDMAFSVAHSDRIGDILIEAEAAAKFKREAGEQAPGPS